MASDRLVTSKHVLMAVMELERRGSRRVLPELERLEPDLIEYLLENLTRLYHELTGFGLPGTDARKAYRLAERTVLVCLLAQRNAHRELWDQGEPGEQDAGEGPDATGGPPADPPP